MNQELVQKATNDLTLEWRQRSRTDLIFLCNNVLGFKDVNEKIHGGMIACLLKFKGGEDILPLKLDGSHYKPFVVNMYDLDGTRNNLVLFFREGFKSSVFSIAHVIQFVLNYPHVRILISTATGRLGEQLIESIENQFRHNEMLRWLFPEICPQGNVKEWGNKEQFVIECRKTVHKEPTVSMLTAGAIMAGGHYDAHYYDDMVDDKNTQTPEQIATIQRHFNMMVPLLFREQSEKMNPDIFKKHGNAGWRNMVGTRYHANDLYGQILESEEKASEKIWKIYIQNALAKGTSPRDPEAVAYWPEKIPLRYLQELEQQPGGMQMISSQYLLNPIPDGAGLISNKGDIRFIPDKIIRQILPALRLHVTIDLHGMEVGKANADNDYTVITLAGFGRDGRPYVVEIRRGRFTPFEVIHHIFDLHQQYPRIFDFKIEKDAHARVLLAFLEREKIKRQKFPMIVPIQRDNRTSKQHRIRGLQSWFQNGDIRFNEEIPCRIDLVNEIMHFPKGKHDDILDTLADQMQNAEGEHNPDVLPTPMASENPAPAKMQLFKTFIGFGQDGMPQFVGDEDFMPSRMTGVL